MDDTVTYIPARDAVKVRGVDGDRVVDCYVKASALAAIGRSGFQDQDRSLACFDEYRDDIEIAAMVKYRRALRMPDELEIEANDLTAVFPASAA